MLPAVAAQLPPLHSVVICRPPSWRGFRSELSLQSLQEVDFLVRDPFLPHSLSMLRRLCKPYRVLGHLMSSKRVSQIRGR